tara:strand:+ start:1244 stop:2686 length:1443 start_codon:yes stop_codon:yes gene_type:complete
MVRHALSEQILSEAQRHRIDAALSLTRLDSIPGQAFALFVVLCVVYLFSIGIRATNGSSITGDEPFYLVTTQSIVEDLDIDLNNQYSEENYRQWFDHPNDLWTQSEPTDDGRLLSPHNTGLPIFLIPGFLAAKLTGAQVQILITAALTFALAFVLAYRLTGAQFISWVSTLAVAVTPTAFVYSTEIYPEVPAALVLVLSLVVVTRTSRPRWVDGLVVLVLLNALLWLGIKYAPLGLTIALVVLWRSERRMQWIFVALTVVSAMFYSWYHIINFGGLTPYAVNSIYVGGSTSEIFQQHVEIPDRVYRLWGLFIDERFGSARWGFILFVALYGGILLVRGSWPQRLIVTLISIQILIATFVAITMMGWWFPGRTMMVVLPLFIVGVVRAIQIASPRVRLVCAALAVHTAAVTVALASAGHAREIRLAVDPFEMSSPLFQVFAPLFPNYTSWSTHTWVTTAGWLIGAGILALYPVFFPTRERT